MTIEDLLFEAKVITIEREGDEISGYVEMKGLQVKVDLSLVPNIVEGERVLICGRVGLSSVAKNHEIRR